MTCTVILHSTEHHQRHRYIWWANTLFHDSKIMPLIHILIILIWVFNNVGSFTTYILSQLSYRFKCTRIHQSAKGKGPLPTFTNSSSALRHSYSTCLHHYHFNSILLIGLPGVAGSPLHNILKLLLKNKKLFNFWFQLSKTTYGIG